MYLPRHRGEAETSEAVPDLSVAARAKAGETVLVVDDEPTVRMLVTEVLEDLGYAAIEAADGASGLKVLQADVRIDLLVTDVGLPGGMNGRQMADAAKVSRPEMGVLFITGYAENAALNHGHLSPGMEILVKPFDLEALATRIRGLIEDRTWDLTPAACVVSSTRSGYASVDQYRPSVLRRPRFQVGSEWKIAVIHLRC